MGIGPGKLGNDVKEAVSSAVANAQMLRSVVGIRFYVAQ
jgi:hypothetical protein